ncbi:hypothetical protein [Sphingopyxis terrae]|uniref:hypothetical protein n=1 Tax=Sphingopyxis terrae TaxID=33052 RepID=UPI002A111DC5|nr:hypothetical protein [Sphingopyxis terrae]MDX8356812.1 hypothetical protein [Sphingopyxis terrae]
MADDSATETVEVSGVYFNGFQIALTNADISGVLLLNGQPQVILNMSFTTAKSLSQALAHVVSELEQVTQRPIMVTKDVDTGIKALMKQKSEAN